MDDSQDRPTSALTVGAALAVASAVLFGVSTPLVQRFGHDVGPFETAALLYLGAALASAGTGRAPRFEAPLRRTHAFRVVGVASLGALLAPVLLAWGLHRTSATAGSLLLTSEAVFTVVFARILYREAVGRRVVAAAVAISLAAGLLVHKAGSVSAPAVLGSVAVLLASFAWAADNVLSRPLADLDPAQVVLAKSAVGAFLALLAATVAGEPLPGLSGAAGLLVTGALGYGVSLRLYLRAQRRMGAARTGSVFACAPFVGALAAWAAGQGSLGWTTLDAAGLIGLGLYLHASERHGHGHRHVALEHEHAHLHDDGHHDHAHELRVDGEHSHRHRHVAEWHEHPHGPDVHHQHDH